MRPTLPSTLLQRLQSLGLASEADLRRVAGPARRLAGELPLFDSVWIDALVRARGLTRWQGERLTISGEADDVAAADAASMCVGPYVLEEPADGCLFGSVYRARHLENGTPVRLTVVERPAHGAVDLAERLAVLPRRLRAVERTSVSPAPLAPVADAKDDAAAFPQGTESARHANGFARAAEGCLLALPIDSGEDERRFWIATPRIEGRTVADWLVRAGRFPPAIVLHLARAMSAGLALLQQHGVNDGDVTASSLFLTDDGSLIFPHPGLRQVVRPSEGYGQADLPPEAFDTLAPERVAEGAPADAATEMYACGLLWWQMLCGRPPLTGGSSLAKLAAAHAARIPPLHEYVTDVPEELARLIEQCARPAPAERPGSFASVTAKLGPPTDEGRDALRHLLSECGRSIVAGWVPANTFGRRPPSLAHARGRVAVGVAAAALVLIGVALSLWPRSIDGWGERESQVAGRSRDAGSRVTGISPVSSRSPGQDARGSSRNMPNRRPVASQAEQADTGGPMTADPGIGTADPITSPEAVTLPADRPIELSRLSLSPGQRAGPAPTATPTDSSNRVEEPEERADNDAGATGRPSATRAGRSTVRIPRSGLVVSVGGANSGLQTPARIEDVDFVWDHAPTADRFLLDLRAEAIVFQRCTFRGESRAGADTAMAPVALRWRRPERSSAEAGRAPQTALPSGWLRLEDCMFGRVGAAVEVDTPGAIRVEVDNVLHRGPGPLVWMHRPPQADEPIVVDLRQVTLREAKALWRCDAASSVARPGPVWFRAEHCALVPDDAHPLILLQAAESPERLLEVIRWTGQGSLLAESAPFIAWRTTGVGPSEQNDWTELDDSRVAIAGLVRSRVEFAAFATDDPRSYRLLHYQAPIRSTEPPGVDPTRLPNQ